MATVQHAVSDMLLVVKSREIQRGMLAEWSGDRQEASRHLLAAAYLELVLANDYAQAGDTGNVMRSQMSAASCFWCAGDLAQGRQIFDEMRANYPEKLRAIDEAEAELK